MSSVVSVSIEDCFGRAMILLKTFVVSCKS